MSPMTALKSRLWNDLEMLVATVVVGRIRARHFVDLLHLNHAAPHDVSDLFKSRLVHWRH
jgi:hypothetical protein